MENNAAKNSAMTPLREFLIGFLSFSTILSAAYITSNFTDNPYIIALLGSIPVMLFNRVLYTQEREQFVNNVKQVVILSNLTQQLDQSGKLLVRRDLELTRANEQLRSLDKMKSEFTSLVTHQLRTPLTGIKWSLSMLLNGEMGELDSKQRLYLMKTYESNERMIVLINDLLRADKLDAKTMKFEFIPTQLVNLLNNVVTEVQPLALKKHVNLILEKIDTLPLIPIDPENVRVVLQNLIENAIKYTPAGGNVKINVNKNANDIELIVADTGIGIPEDQKNNIFRRFFRAPNALHTETDGTGLGLYIVESIIKRHNGSIRFESEEGKGTTFFVTLPVMSESAKVSEFKEKANDIPNENIIHEPINP